VIRAVPAAGQELMVTACAFWMMKISTMARAAVPATS
jgi:hypothetical protein